jgi:hypothetical protein
MVTMVTMKWGPVTLHYLRGQKREEREERGKKGEKVGVTGGRYFIVTIVIIVTFFTPCQVSAYTGTIAEPLIRSTLITILEDT